MTKRKQENPDTPPGARTENQETTIGNQQSEIENQIDALKTQLTEAQAKAQEYLDALQRERADFVNYRRRVEQEKEQMGQWTTGETVKK